MKVQVWIYIALCVGFMSLPGYDLQGAILKNWEDTNKVCILNSTDVARYVLNRCTTVTGIEGESGKQEIRYNYRYLEDIRQPSEIK